MPTRSLIGIRGYIEGLVGGYKSLNPADLQNNNPPEHEYEVVLGSALNTIAVPGQARGVIIIPAATSTVDKTLRGVAGDTGLAISRDRWSVLSFNTPPPANIIVHASTADVGFYTRFVFF